MLVKKKSCSRIDVYYVGNIVGIFACHFRFIKKLVLLDVLNLTELCNGDYIHVKIVNRKKNCRNEKGLNKGNARCLIKICLNNVTSCYKQNIFYIFIFLSKS